VVRRVIAPTSLVWELLLTIDRERVVQWARQANTGLFPPALPAFPRPIAVGPEPVLASGQSVPVLASATARLVSDIQAERRWRMRARTWRDMGLLMTLALAGAAVAIYVQPPFTRLLAWIGTAWLITVLGLVQYAARRAKGKGIVGTPEGNAKYYADPERFALGGVQSFGWGVGLGIVAMLAALTAKLL